MDASDKIIDLLIKLGILTAVVNTVFKSVKRKADERKKSPGAPASSGRGLGGFYQMLEELAASLEDDEPELEGGPEFEEELYQGYLYQEPPSSEAPQEAQARTDPADPGNNAWIREDRKVTADFGREIMEDEITGDGAYDLKEEGLVEELMADPQRAYLYSEIFSQPKWKS